jgi:hypothetical protein
MARTNAVPTALPGGRKESGRPMKEEKKMASNLRASNRLPELAAKINAAHVAVNRHIKATIHEMMAAGDALREAKKLAGHGKWLSWLKTNCPDVSERTAHLYMQLAKWRSVVEDAMAKSATIADFERDQLKVPMASVGRDKVPVRIAVGPFGVVDAIAAIHEAEHYENVVKENRLQLAAGPKPPHAWAGADHSLRYPRAKWAHSDLAREIQSFANDVKCCLSRIGTDQHRRAQFLKQARLVLDAMEAQPPNRLEAPATVSAIPHGEEKANGRTHAIVS